MKHLITCLTVCVLSNATFADVWTVDDDGKADFDNIQAAVDAASSGDDILVMPGTYTVTPGSGTIVQIPKNKHLWIHSSEGPENTIIDGDGSSRGFSFAGYNWEMNTVEGFSITNCVASVGAGMYMWNAWVTVKDCNFSNNAATGSGESYGGAIFVDAAQFSASLVVLDCNFLSNTAQGNGGAIGFKGGGDLATITNCTFQGNTSAAGGGAIWLAQIGQSISNCTFTGNQTATWGGAVFTEPHPNGWSTDSYGAFTDCQFTSNTAGGVGGALALFGNQQCYTCDFIGNTASGEGGAIYCSNGNDTTAVSACSFEDNQATYGGAIRAAGSSIQIHECDLRNNFAAVGGALYSEGWSPSPTTLASSTVCGNRDTQIYHDQWYTEYNNTIRWFCDFGTWVVDANGNGDFINIQDAIDAASSGDSIQIQPGTYTYSGNEGGEVLSINKPLYIFSATGNYEDTIIDGQDKGRCAKSGSEGVIIEGLTFQNGKVSNERGGGMLITSGDAVIRNCVFQYNQSNYHGPGLCIQNASLQIENSQFNSNTNNDFGASDGDGGGALTCLNSDVTVSNCSFTNNQVAGFGGGMYVKDSSVDVSDSIFTSNSISYPDIAEQWFRGGGGLCLDNSGGTISNCEFVNNSTSGGSSTAKMRGGGLVISTPNLVDVTSCQFTNNSCEKGGGGLFIAVTGSSPDIVVEIKDCEFNDNTATEGGAICFEESTNTTVEGCEFNSNSVGSPGIGGQGGAIRVVQDSETSIEDCIFRNNSANQGGAVSISGNSEALLRDCTFSAGDIEYAADEGGAIWIMGDCSATIDNCAFQSISVALRGAGISFDWEVISECIVTDSTFESLIADGQPQAKMGGAIHNPSTNNPIFLVSSTFCSNVPIDIYGPFTDVGCEFYPICPGLVRQWINEDGGLFQNSNNWWYPYVPDETNKSIFNLDSQYTITFNEDAYSSALNVLQGTATLDLNNYYYELSSVYEISLLIGQDSDSFATLNLQNGAIICESTMIGRYPNSNGQLSLSGSMAYLVSMRDLDIGFGGNGNLLLDSGAYLVSRNASIGALPGSHGSAILQGENTTWDIPFFLIIDQGEVEVGIGSELNVGYLTTIFQDGLLTGDGTINSNILNFGEVIPGDSQTGYGALSINGDYEQVGEIPVLGSGAGILKIKIGATEKSSIVATGIATLGGGLIANLSETYDPSTGSTFRLLSSASVIDQFDVVLMPGLSDGKYMSLAYDEVGIRTGAGGIDIIVDTFANLLGFDDPDNVPIAGSPTSMTIADFNNDSFDDIAVTLAGADENSPGNVLVLISDGLGGFLSTQQITVGSNPLSVTAGDFNNDSSIDIAVACESDNAISIVQNLANGDGTFDASWSFNVGNSPRDIEAIDLNNDGIDDLVVVVSEDDAIELWHSSTPLGNPVFALGDTLWVGDDPHDIDPGDVNDDKVNKFVVTNYGDDTATVWEQNVGITSGTWTSSTITTGNLPTKVKQADLNADGFLDVVISNSGDGTASVILASDNGYLPQVQLPVGNSPASLSIVDFDNDGDNDIAIVADNEDGHRVVKVLRSDLNLTNYEQLIFASATELGDGESPAFIDHGDMDGNGQEELISVSETTAFRGENTAVVSMRKNTNATTCLGDINFDSKVDVSDLLILIGDWGICVDCISDLDGDGIVRVNDILILISNWGPCE